MLSSFVLISAILANFASKKRGEEGQKSFNRWGYDVETMEGCDLSVTGQVENIANLSVGVNFLILS